MVNYAVNRGDNNLGVIILSDRVIDSVTNDCCQSLIYTQLIELSALMCAQVALTYIKEKSIHAAPTLHFMLHVSRHGGN